MNNRNRENLQNILRYFPPALIILMLVLFSYFSWNYKLIVDDFQFQTVMKEKSILNAAVFFYDGFNGRMASHIFLCSVFRIFQNKENLFFIYHFIMLSGFVISLAHFLKKYLETFRNNLLTNKKAIYWSAFITSFLFFFFFAGRVELWFWVSATGVYLISFIISLNAFAFALNKNQNAKTIIFSLILFFLVGGFSESFALMYLLILLSLFIFALKKNSIIKKNIISIGLGILGIVGALLINVLSPGIQNRLGWLPSFRIQQAIINTIHSLAFPILRYKHLPFVIVLIGLFLLYTNGFSRKAVSKITFWKKGLMILVFIIISFFIPSYLLSDVVPDRAASLGYFIGVLFLFDHFLLRNESFPS